MGNMLVTNDIYVPSSKYVVKLQNIFIGEMETRVVKFNKDEL
jgi:hypothetical protein